MKTNKIIMIIAAIAMVIGLVVLFITTVNPDIAQAQPIVFELGLLALFGAGTSNVMIKKGRSGALGWVLGFFLTFIGLLICVLLPKKAGVLAEDEMICPHCKEVIKAGATVCKYCKMDPRLPPAVTV